MFGVPKAAHPGAGKAVTADLNRAALPDGWQDFRINLRFEKFSPARAEASLAYRLVEHAAKFEPRLHLNLGLGILGGIGASER